jgi:hypothetical protein
MHRIALAIAVVLSPGAAPSSPPGVSLPPAKQVLERYLEVTGGRAAHEKLRHKTLSGRFEVKARGLNGTFLLQQSAPDKLTMKVVLPGLGTVVTGSDGTHAWEVSDATGPRLLQGGEKDEAMLQAAFDADLRPETVYARMETVRVEEISGKPAYVVELTPRRGGPPRTYFFERDSGLLVKILTTAATAMGESLVSDYRAEGAILTPHTLTLTALGMQQVMTVESFSTAPVPPDAYAMPAAVRALLAPAK